MKTIYKYSIGGSDKLTLPKGAEILDIQLQHGNLYMWAKIDTMETEVEDRTIRMFGTGHMIDESIIGEMKFIATVQFDGGNLIFHFFEIL